MFLRLLFTLLIALNIAVGAWLLWGQDDTHGRSAATPGVPTLQLLSEQPAAVPAPAQSAAPPPARKPVPDATGGIRYRCLALGPFASPQDLRNARTALAAPQVRMHSRQEQTRQSRGWWVYLPATRSRADALAQARQLGVHGITDYFVVSSGDQPNTVSLGLFKDPDNARKRRDQVAAEGFPAQMSERIDTVPEYWLDVTVRDGQPFDWRSRVPDPDVGSHSASCF